jgi:hypothetical protein
MRRFARRLITRPTQVPVIAALALTAVGGACNGITPKETFMLAYIDNASPGRIRVRHSDDGTVWSVGDPRSGIADAGIGAAAGEDPVGLMRVLVHNGNIARFHFRFGIGAQDWDYNDHVAGTDPRPRGVPQIAYGASPGWLVTDIGGISGFVPTVHWYSSNNRTFTDVSPSSSDLNLAGLNVHAAPAIMSRGGRVLLAYLRHSGIGNNAVLVDAQLLRGDIGTGNAITWSPATVFNPPEAGFGPPLTRPALAHDNNNYYLATVRRANSGNALRLFIYSSPDRVTWTTARIFDQVPTVTTPEELNVGLAGKSNGVMVLMFTAPTVAKMYRSPGGNLWNEIPANIVFSGSTPAWFRSALMAAGQPPPAQ